MPPLDVLALHHFAFEDGVDGLMGGADDAFVTGAAGLILLNPNHQKLFPPSAGGRKNSAVTSHGARTCRSCIRSEMKRKNWSASC
jgi:hypothetical protein